MLYLGMKKSYRPWDTDRTYLLPPSTRDWLPEGHLASFILDVVEELDVGAIEDPIQAKDHRGERAYEPRMMVALLLYGYSTGVFSSRKLAQATWTDLGARVLAAEAHPHFTTINQFRLDHHKALSALFLQVLKLCQKAGLVDLGHVAVDGTKIQANASKHKAMSHTRMLESERRLEGEVAALMAEAEAVNKREDTAFGDGDGSTIPDELKRRETRLIRIREARQALEEEAKEARRLELRFQAKKARESMKKAENTTDFLKAERRAMARDAAVQKLGPENPTAIPGAKDELPFHKVPHDKTGAPKGTAQRNFTDSDSRIMGRRGAFQQAYNGQIAVAEKNQIIVAQLLTNQPPDAEHLVPILEQVRESLDAFPTKLTADAGYWNESNGSFCEDAAIDAYISTRRRRHREHQGDQEPARPPPIASRTKAGLAMEAKVTSEEGRVIYAKRKWVVEPVFGQLKECRGVRRFKLRTLPKVRSEFSLHCTGHNLLKLWRSTTTAEE